MKKLLRFCLGLAMIPVCVAVTRTAVALVRAVQPSAASALPPPVWALAGGFLFWLFLYYTAPRPMRSYVLAHELTHALWALLMGAKVSRIEVSSARGSVTLSKSNMLITLAPYFFPFYTMLTIVVYGVLALFFEVEAYHLVWIGLIGFTWGFHFTFTITTLMQHQSDIQQYGRLFSYSVIYAFNALGICLWVVAVTGVTLEQLVTGLSADLRWVAGPLAAWTREWMQ